ncbi:hypothetical protein [Permianibacter aggregans]|uniref:Uncharacterized protein n=1 Tax=Permianibacter aggregans TaxID=1510150 RepID=A0A4R6V138_9GAMM|nr:hypothetical protein [Permianibacter aggregans]QGX39532.1 hypothetical protein E2H98_07630 [Permianibacter aggregans]TDQ49724.1 hypothetical protein EV696_10393 [Permianibacter aggregans]
MKRVLLLMLAIGGSLSVFADSRLTRFDDPIPLAHYVVDARAVIVAGMNKHGWVIHAETDNYIEALLDKPANQVLLRIGFDNRQITFVRISDVSTDCGKRNGKWPKSCPVDEDDMDRWRNNLRKAILKHIEQLARYDALQRYMESTGKAPRRSPELAPEANDSDSAAESEG